MRLYRMTDWPKHWLTGIKTLLRPSCFFFSIAIYWTALQLCYCQCPLGSLTFEKIAGVSLRGVRFLPLYKGYQGDSSLTAECLSRCRATDQCQSVLLSYPAMNCMQSSMSSEGRRVDISATTPPSATTFFEKICLTVPRCQRLWAFERVIGFEISGFDDRTIPGVSTRLQCEELCLREKGFFCRSGEFDYAFQQCRLSSEDRRSQPSSFRPAFGDVDYFENQCAPEGSTGCNYEVREDLEVDRTDTLLTTNTEAECQQQCDSNQAFLCHAFSYRPSASTCRLSADDTFNMGPAAVRKRKGTDYYQKSNCLDLKLTCISGAMRLILSTREPFNGRIYAQSQPYSCQVYGKRQTITEFTMSVDGNCGVEMEGDIHLTNTVVIQYHPLIQQKGDRIIKLYCSLFGENNRTVTKSFKVGTGAEPAVTAVVNATAPTPNIRLRITDLNGTDVTGVKIGDPLLFKIDIDEDSVFGIFARDLSARNGKNDKKIPLLDDEGCPTDPRIFPGFEKVPGMKSLQAKFLAFKFSGDPVVRFEVNVHFCLEECEEPNCAGGQPSWGKRKRRQIVTEVPIVPDYPLEAAIVVEGADFRDNSTENPHHSAYQDFPPDELVCTTKIVVVVSALGALFLQLGFLAACATCLLLSRKDKHYKETDAASTITNTLPPFESDQSRLQ